MSRRLFCVAPALGAALLVLAAPAERPVVAQGKVAGRVDHPRLRAALHEMREARGWLVTARDSWPPGYKERAVANIDAAMKSVQTILQVKDVNSFVGVERNADYYKRFRDHPRLRAALQDLRDARDELRTAKADFGGLKEQALDDIDAAVGDIVVLLRNNKR
jgi:hypothetical protein